MFTVTVSAKLSYNDSPELPNWADPPHSLIFLLFFMFMLTTVFLVVMRTVLVFLDILPEKLPTDRAVQPFHSSFHLWIGYPLNQVTVVWSGPTIYYVECT